MFSEAVQTKDGHTKNVVARSKEELTEAVKVARDERVRASFDINVAVQQGHDQLAVGADAQSTAPDAK